MKKTIKLLIATAAPFIVSASNLFGQLETLLTANGYDSYQPPGYRELGSVGGEFTAYVYQNGTSPSVSLYAANYNPLATATLSNGKVGFETFCIEMTYDFEPGNTYQTSVGNSIVPGIDPNPSSTPLAAGVAYLYSQFAQGILAGYCYTPGAGRDYTADELQDAIWYLQGEINANTVGDTQLGYDFNTSDPTSDPFVALAESVCGTNGAFASDAGNNYGVQVLNLSNGPADINGYNQDQLVYTCPVPEPATFAAGAMLLVPLGVSAYRKLRKKS